MSAALLREAAGKMRRQAGDVAEECGLFRTGTVAYPLWFESTDDYASGGSATHQHIASWPPSVTLAVADLLDWEADHIGRVDLRGNAHAARKAIAVARAYLGRDS